MASDQQQFCVRWNSYQTNLQNAFPKLLTSEHFVDVTLACENEMIKCHKVVLSACSSYFEKLLVRNPCQHPIIFMKDMRFAEIQALVDFMYKGEVNVTQDELPSLLRSAEALQIRGLSGSDQLLNQPCLQQPQQAAQPIAASTPQSGAQIVQPVPQMPPLQPQPQLQPSSEDTPKKTPPDDPGASTASSELDLDSGKDEHDIKEEMLMDNDDSYYDNDLDTEYLDQDDEEPSTSMKPLHGTPAGAGGPGADGQKPPPEFAMANVSCHYDSSPSGSLPGISTVARRIRRSEAELKQAAECITRGQTFQNVSDQFNIPISTIRFYMARKGILPRRKRGRACSAPSTPTLGHIPAPSSQGFHGMPGNTSPIGPPYHIVHYKLPVLGTKLK